MVIPLVVVLPSVGVAVVPCRTLPMPAVSVTLGGASPVNWRYAQQKAD